MLRFLAYAIVVTTSLAACADSTAPASVPDAPENVQVALRVSEIEISWRDVSSDEDIFLIEVAIDNGPFITLTQAPRNSTRAIYPDPKPGLEFRFRVSACNRAGCSTVLERTTDTHTWLEPRITSASASTTTTTGIRVNVAGIHHGHDVDIDVILYSDDNGYRVRHTETIRPRAGIGERSFAQVYYFSGVTEGATYSYLVSLRNAYGTASAPIGRVIVDFSRPFISNLMVRDVMVNSVGFTATIRPGGTATSVFVAIAEGDAPLVVPGTLHVIVPPDPLGNSANVQFSRFALQPGRSYRGVMTASNMGGSVTSGEFRFTTPWN